MGKNPRIYHPGPGDVLYFKYVLQCFLCSGINHVQAKLRKQLFAAPAGIYHMVALNVNFKNNVGSLSLSPGLSVYPH